MTSDSTDMEDGVKNLFGKVMIEKLSLKTKAEDKYVSISKMVINVDTLEINLWSMNPFLHFKVKHWR